jgi:hypothetical protein
MIITCPRCFKHYQIEGRLADGCILSCWSCQFEWSHGKKQPKSPPLSVGKYKKYASLLLLIVSLGMGSWIYFFSSNIHPPVIASLEWNEGARFEVQCEIINPNNYAMDLKRIQIVAYRLENNSYKVAYEWLHEFEIPTLLPNEKRKFKTYHALLPGLKIEKIDIRIP